jgi:hypothetical protein
MSRLTDRKIVYSCWLTLILFLTVIIAGTITELFQAPTITTHDLDRYIYLFDQNYFKVIDKIVIKNSLVSFTLEKGPDRWMMAEPRRLPIDDNALQSLFTTLEEIKIKRTLTYEPINLTNYNLTNPTTEILLSAGEDTTSIKIGLVNPIDDSCYIALEERDAIYHASNFSSKIDSIDLTTFIDARVFDIPIEEITDLAIQINRSSRKFTFAGDEWREYNRKVKDAFPTYLQELLSLQCQTILDLFGPSAKIIIDQYLQNPPITITINSNQQYILSNPVSTIPGIRMERNQNVLAKLANGQLCLINRRRTQFITDDFRNI